MHFELGNDFGSFPLLLDRDDFRQRLRRNDNGGCMNRVLPSKTLEAPGRIDDGTDVGIGVIELA